MLQSAPVVGGSSARLYLDAIGAPVVARVTHRSQDRLTVSRELPFLKLHSSVRDEGGRRAEVASVSVVVEDGTPRLVLELAYRDAEGAQAASAGKRQRDATVPYVVERAKRDAPPQTGALSAAREREATIKFVPENALPKERESALKVASRPSSMGTLRWLYLLFLGALGNLSRRLRRAPI